MLSEPRRRQKWSLNPRGTLWSNDESKFGKKLMEKMGWKSGDGLGSQGQGIVDPITVAANQDKKGIGHQGESRMLVLVNFTGPVITEVIDMPFRRRQ